MPILALALLSACSTPDEGRVVVLGLDGLEYAMLDRLIAEGDLPNFERVMAEGARADLTITTPIMSPILWTTAASGYAAEDHGIGGWTTGRGHGFSGADVRTMRVWDAVSAAGDASVVSGWLMTWPATPLRGSMLSERFVWSFPMNKDPNERSAVAQVEAPRELDATTFPESLAARASALRPDDAWVAASPLGYQVQEYGAPFHPLLRDETHVRVFEALWPEADARFGAVYLNGADQVSHLYWPFADPVTRDAIHRDPAAHTAAAQAAARPGRRPPPYADGIDAAELEQAARYVPDYYRYLDGVLGRVVALLDEDTTLIVMSDHGFRTSSAQPLINGSHNEVAVFLAWGDRVKPGRGAVHIFDVAPTIYALLGLPAAADMPGKVATDLFDVAPQAPVPTRKLERAPVEVGAGDQGVADAQLREQLQALGYIDENGLPETNIGGSRKTRQ